MWVVPFRRASTIGAAGLARRNVEQLLVFIVLDPVSGQTLWGQADLVPISPGR